MLLGKFPDSLEFQSWKVNFKTEVCAKSAFPHITMHWIKEVEIAKSTDELMTSRSILARTDVTVNDMRDAMSPSALKKLLDKHAHFRRRVSVEEQRAQKDDRFLRGRQIAYIIYEHFRATGVEKAVQGLSDLFNIRLQNDDIQDFDTRWDHALLAASEIPTEIVLEGLYKSELQDSVQLQTVLALYARDNIRNNEPPSYSRLKTTVRRHIDQTMMTRNFRARNEIVDRGAVTKSQKGRQASVDRKVGECFHWKAIGQCSKGDSCSFSNDPASGNRCDQRQEGKSSSPAPNAQAQTDGKIHSKSSGRRGESLSGTRGRSPCRKFLWRTCTYPSCNFWHPPVCLNYKSESGCAYGEKCRFRHAEADGQPSKKSKKSGVRGPVALLKESFQMCCVSQDSHPKNSILRKEGKVGLNHTVAPH